MNLKIDGVNTSEIWLTRCREEVGSSWTVWAAASMIGTLFPNGIMLSEQQMKQTVGVKGYRYDATGKRGSKGTASFTRAVRKFGPDLPPVKGPLVEVLARESWFELVIDQEFDDRLEEDFGLWGDGVARRHSENGQSERNVSGQQFTTVVEVSGTRFGAPPTKIVKAYFRHRRDYDVAKSGLKREAA